MPKIIERLAEQGIHAERKSIYRDIAALRDIGVEIQTLPKRPVEYVLVRSELGIDDVMMLVDIVQSSRFITERQSNRLVKNLKGLVSERERKLLDKRVHVQDRIKSQSESIFHSVDVIHEALQRKRKIQFLYFSYGTNLKRSARHEGKRYEVTPAKVVFADNNYYLAAYDDSDEMVKTYRVDRMKIAQISTQPATRCAAVANYGTDAFAYQRFSMFHGDPKCVTLRVEAELMDAVIDRFGRGVEVAQAAEDHADIRVNVEVSAQFFGWIAGLDGKVTIQAPTRLPSR
jgi:predicted DNA-binding transcriptional regulator YafY